MFHTITFMMVLMLKDLSIFIIAFVFGITKGSFLGNFYVANESCALRSVFEYENDHFSYETMKLPAWTRTTVLLSGWASFIGCFITEKIEIDRQMLATLFQKGSELFGPLNFLGCLFQCTDIRYASFVFYRHLCLCLGTYPNDVLTVSSQCFDDNKSFWSPTKFPVVFGLLNNMPLATSIETNHLYNGLQCLVLENNAIRNCGQSLRYRCDGEKVSRGYGDWISATFECFRGNKTLPVYTPHNTNEGIWTKYFRFMHVVEDWNIKDLDLIETYPSSHKCIVLDSVNSANSTKTIVKLVNCSKEYSGRFCSDVNRNGSYKLSVRQTTTTDKENTYIPLNNGSTVGIITTTEKVKTFTHPNNEGTGRSDIWIVITVLLSCICLICLIAFIRKLYKKRLSTVTGEQNSYDSIHYGVGEENFTFEL